MYNKKKETYRIMSIFIVILMLMSTFFNISAFAENNALSFVYDSYIIEYTLNNEWENNQNVEIKLTNTGNETIYNWALGFDTGGEISGLWNGKIYDRKEINHD